MFATNGFIKVSERRMDASRAKQKAANLGGLRQVRSDPVLPRIASSKKMHMMDAVHQVADDSAPLGRRRAESKVAVALMPPGRLEEVSGEVLASIEGIRASMEHFQGRRHSAAEQAQREEDPDALEDLQQRLACYRYARRIEPPPPPLAMDPSFGPAPPRPEQLVIPKPSASHLQSYLPQRRRVKLAEQAETRRLRLQAAKMKREMSEQEQTEKTWAEVDRYQQRMDRFEHAKQGNRGGGQRRMSLLSFSLGQQLEERRKQFLQIAACAAFCHRATKLLDGFQALGQVCLTRFNAIVQQETGVQARPFAKAAALMVWRSSYARVMRERLLDQLSREASPRNSPTSPRSPSSQGTPSHRSLMQEPHGPMLRSLPLLDKFEVRRFLPRINFIEGMLEVRLRVRRKRAQARCIHLMLQKWYPFAIQRMLRHVYGCVKRLQQFLRRSLLRLKAIRITVKAQMLQIEKEQVEKELLEEEAKTEAKRKAYGSAPKTVMAEQVNRALLPDAWRSQIANSLLRQRRRQQLQLLQEWRVDMSTYHWEVVEWRKSHHALPIPVMPAYPTHVPSNKVLAKLIDDARKLRLRRPSHLPLDLSLLHLEVGSSSAAVDVGTWGAGWHRRKDDNTDAGYNTDAFSSKVVEMRMPAERCLEMPNSIFLR